MHTVPNNLSNLQKMMEFVLIIYRYLIDIFVSGQTEMKIQHEIGST